jgi:hypothetical protein
MFVNLESTTDRFMQQHLHGLLAARDTGRKVYGRRVYVYYVRVVI